MADLTIPFALIRQRRNPARIAHRNLHIVQGEDVDIAITIYNQDTDSAPLAVTNFVPVMAIFRDRVGGGHRWCGWGGAAYVGDYGWGLDGAAIPLAVVAGLIQPAAPSTAIIFPLSSAVTTPLGGRYHFYIYNYAPGLIATLGEGILEVEGSAYAQPGLLGTEPQQTVLVPDGNLTGDFFVPS